MTANPEYQTKSNFTNQIFAPFCEAAGYGTPEVFADILYGRYVVEDFGFGDDYLYWGVHGYFLEKVVPHKIAVFNAGKRLAEHDWFSLFIAESGENWLNRLWLHDLSKFAADESFGYALYNFTTKSGKAGFDRAWHHHKQHNTHHPEYWLSVGKGGEVEVLEMPKIDIAQMLAECFPHADSIRVRSKMHKSCIVLEVGQHGELSQWKLKLERPERVTLD